MSSDAGRNGQHEGAAALAARVVADEALDHLPAHDPAAQRSRRDLRRIHVVMGTRGIVAAALRRAVAPRPSGRPLRLLELGCGDASLMLAVARRLAPAWPAVELTLLDRQDVVAPATLRQLAALGWHARARVGDALAWAADGAPGASGRWDAVVATLFLHHFEGPALAALLAAVARQADAFVACEPRRSALALAGSRLVGALGANAVTRADAVLSVRAGFRDRELAAAWPRTAPDWTLDERAAGAFSHLLVARRDGAA